MLVSITILHEYVTSLGKKKAKVLIQKWTFVSSVYKNCTGKQHLKSILLTKILLIYFFSWSACSFQFRTDALGSSYKDVPCAFLVSFLFFCFVFLMIGNQLYQSLLQNRRICWLCLGNQHVSKRRIWKPEVLKLSAIQLRDVYLNWNFFMSWFETLLGYGTFMYSRNCCSTVDSAMII